MRSSQVEVLTYGPANEILGLVFNASYCAEQEWGIRDLQAIFGIGDDVKKLGLDRRTGVATHFGAGDSWFWIERGYLRDDKLTLPDLKRMHDVQNTGSDGCAAGWDGGSCGIWSTTKASDPLQEAIGLISAALLSEQPMVVMLTGSSSPFGRSGLLIAPRAKLDRYPEIDAQLTAVDLEVERLREAWEPVEKMLKEKLSKPKLHRFEEKYFAETEYQHIRDTLARRGKTAMYMAPRSLQSAPAENSKYPFRVWLNPDQQNLHACGWYTVEELEQWADGTGPVIENSEYVRTHMAVEEILAGKEAYPPDYTAICRVCGHVWHNGNASGRKEMLNHYKDNHGYDKLVKCPKCDNPGDNFVFADDNPKHYRNKRE